jgi:hypothetical protein
MDKVEDTDNLPITGTNKRKMIGIPVLSRGFRSFDINSLIIR